MEPHLETEWYDLLEEVAGAFYNALSTIRVRLNETAPLAPLLAVRSGYAESPGWFMVQAAEFEPEPLTGQNLRVRDTYAAERLAQALLDLMASEKWFDRNARQEYALTDAGREMLDKIFARRRGWLEQLRPEEWVRVEIVETEKTLRALIDASLTTEHTWCLAHSRRRAPLQEISTLGKIFQYLEDLNAFRDDAHMAAWQPTGVLGYEWETFAFVATARATNAPALFDQLHYRGYARTEFADALNALAWRGWLERADGDEYRVTAQGQAIHAEVEERTNEYFFAPWKILSAVDIQQLRVNLTRLRGALNATAG